MHKILRAILIVIFTTILSYLVYRLTDIAIASCIIGIIGVSVGLYPIVGNIQNNAEIESKIKIRKNAEDTKITGVVYSGNNPIPSTKSEIDIEKIKGGEVTGVKSMQNKN